MKSITQKRRLKKSIRETLIVIVAGTIGAVCLLAMLIGAAIQTNERLEVMAMEVDR